MALSDFVSDSSVQTKRNALADYHITARSDGENNFYGFTDVSGFTTQTATSMGDLATKLSALTTTSNVVIKCQWNGVSSTATRPGITNASGLTANGAVDWGYNRPDCKVQIVPDTGYTPILQGTFGGNTFEIDGAQWIEFNGCTFQDTTLDFRRNATYPSAGIIAVKNCTFNGASSTAIKAIHMRSIHVENCAFDNTLGVLNGATEFRRFWNNTITNLKEDDINAIRDFTGFAANWIAHSWVFGNFCFNVNPAVQGGGFHTDFLQIDHANNPVGYYQLVEFNIADINDAVGSADSQALFGNCTTAYDGEWCVHNNIFLINAYHAATVADANDNANKYVYRNMTLPAGLRGDTLANTPWIRGNRRTAGTGSLTVSENYTWVDASNTGRVAGESFTNNRHVDFSTGAPTGDKPETLFTFSVGLGTNSNGHRSYSFATTGLSKSAAKAKILDNLKPIGGWRVNNYGPTDPANWPTNPQTLAGGMPNVGNSLTLRVVR